MTDLNSSVHDEQFGKKDLPENMDKNETNQTGNENSGKAEELQAGEEEKQEKLSKEENGGLSSSHEEKKEEENLDTEEEKTPHEDTANNPEQETEPKIKEASSQLSEETEKEEKKEGSDPFPDHKDEEINTEQNDTSIAEDESSSEEKSDKEEEKQEVTKEDSFETESSDAKDEKEGVTDTDQQTEAPEKKETADENVAQSPKEKKEDSLAELKIEELDFSTYSKEDLVDLLNRLLNEKDIGDFKDEVEIIKTQFYKKYKNVIETKKKQFIDQGGELEDFRPEPDMAEENMKELLKRFRELKAEYNQKLEEEKQENLLKKYEVIEGIQELINRKESINQTFQEFRELQKKWHNIGLVPQQNVKDMWETYHYHVEKFYDYIKINKELRDLDLKKNLEAKILLCEKTEKLIFEPSIVNAFRTLQEYHEQWREIGPVPRDQKTEIWNRFKEITAKINRKHHEYFENLKEQQKNNLKEKELLCEKADAIANDEPANHTEWEEKSNELIELQKIWKTIGFAPKKDNNKIYNRFRGICDDFFARKRDFYAKNKEQQKENLQLKTELCIRAEALKDSTDWKNTTDELINLQKEWKRIGPVPKKFSDPVWHRFRSACDAFFDNKSKFFANIDETYEDNLKKKEELIEEILNYKIKENVEESLKDLNAFQKRWTDIGFVPIKQKDEIQQKYRDAINKTFDKLLIDDNERSLLKFKNKLTNMKDNPRIDQKLRAEREKYINRLLQLENDIVVWENNIGFFADSKNADAMIKDVNRKINNAKKTIDLLKKKIKMIEDFS